MPQKHSATIPTPPVSPLESTLKPEQNKKTDTQQALELNALFMSMAIQMSWQLAVVVIVPIVGGYLLDSKFHTTPWLLIVGFGIASLGVFGVLRRVLMEANQRTSGAHTTKGAS